MRHKVKEEGHREREGWIGDGEPRAQHCQEWWWGEGICLSAPMERGWRSRNMLSLYVHLVVVNDNNERAPVRLNHGSNRERHLTEAELRMVYTRFISPLVDNKLTEDEVIDQKLFSFMNDIMILTTRELNRVQGHLRQFIRAPHGARAYP
jgi:hypothetical protein